MAKRGPEPKKGTPETLSIRTGKALRDRLNTVCSLVLKRDASTAVRLLIERFVSAPDSVQQVLAGRIPRDMIGAYREAWLAYFDDVLASGEHPLKLPVVRTDPQKPGADR
jgi:hypothetical protein